MSTVIFRKVGAFRPGPIRIDWHPPISDWLVATSRAINTIVHFKPHIMFCTFVWTVPYRQTIWGYVWLARIAPVIYVPSRYVLDAGFFVARLGQRNHCEKCAEWEIQTGAVRCIDIEGLHCSVSTISRMAHKIFL
ncbi:MAG: hypothetical protein R3B60_05070 [Candidatus Paceibacterota bacterium]